MSQEVTRQSRIATQIATKQEQISSGKRMQRASDDPFASSRIAEIGRLQSNDSARNRNISLGISFTGQADGLLGSMSTLLERAQELILSAVSDTNSQSGRNTIATELAVLANDMRAMSEANSVTGEKLFPEGSPNAIRFDDEVAFAPVPSAQSIFNINGTSITDIILDAASAIEADPYDAPLVGLSLTAIGRAIEHIADNRATIGANAARLERLQEFSAQRAIELSVERSNLEDTDLSSAIMELNVLSVTLEAAQGVFSKINMRTLLDFLL